jgi:hypothetical protein
VHSIIIKTNSSTRWVLTFLLTLISSAEISGTSRNNNENQEGYRHPSERNLESLDVEVKSGTQTLRGWFIKAPNYNSTYTVVFFHGNAGSINLF